MRRPPLSRSYAFIAVALGALWFVAAPVSAQQSVPDTGYQFPFVVDALIGGIASLVICGGFIVLVPEYTERTTDRIIDDPGETFLYGLGISIALFVVIFLLAITIIGIVLAIPLAFVVAIIGQLGYLAAGRTASNEWYLVLLTAVVVGALSNGIPILGALIGFILSSMGLGAVYLDYKDDSDTRADSKTPDFGTATGGGVETDTDSANVTDEWGSDSQSEAAIGEDSVTDEWTVGFDADEDESDGENGDGGGTAGGWSSGVDEDDGW